MFPLTQLGYGVNIPWEARLSHYLENLTISVARGDFLVVHWLRICLPMQSTQVRSLVGELISQMSCGNDTHVLQTLSPRALGPRAPQEKCLCLKERSCCCNQDPAWPKNKPKSPARCEETGMPPGGAGWSVRGGWQGRQNCWKDSLGVVLHLRSAVWGRCCKVAHTLHSGGPSIKRKESRLSALRTSGWKTDSWDVL